MAEPPPRRVPRDRGRGLQRLVALLIALVVLVVIVAVLVSGLSTSTSHSVVHLRQVAGRDLNSVVSQFQQLIGSNTGH